MGLVAARLQCRHMNFLSSLLAALSFLAWRLHGARYNVLMFISGGRPYRLPHISFWSLSHVVRDDQSSRRNREVSARCQRAICAREAVLMMPPLSQVGKQPEMFRSRESRELIRSVLGLGVYSYCALRFLGVKSSGGVCFDLSLVYFLNCRSRRTSEASAHAIQ